jgi:hypothetical protein
VNPQTPHGRPLMLNEYITKSVFLLATNENNFSSFPCCGHSFVYFNAKIKKHKKFVFPQRRGIKEVKKLSNEN